MAIFALTFFIFCFIIKKKKGFFHMIISKNKPTYKDNQSIPKLSISNLIMHSRLTDDQDEFLHCHDFFEAIFIYYGNISHCINGQIYDMKVGDACIVAPNTQHSFIRKDQCAHRDIMISDALFKKACEFMNISLYNELNEKGLLRFTVSNEQLSNLEYLYKLLIEADNEDTLQICAKNISCQLIGQLYTYNKIATSSDPFTNKCITIINDHYADKNILNILLAELGYTQGHFCKKFKNTFQVSPIKYINRRKIISAASTLVLTNYSVEKCCHLVGFESLPHFIKLFKEHYGLTPTRYRHAYKLSSNRNNK